MELQGRGFPRAFLKSKPLGRNIYEAPPLFEAGNPGAWRNLLKPQYGLETACREWYETLGNTLTDLGGGGGDIARQVSFFWAMGNAHYGFG